MDTQGLLCHKQWGFRKNYSTESLLLHLTETWRNALDKGLNLGVLFIDFRKVFDTVNYTILLGKLKAIGVSGDWLSWLDDYMSARKQFVQLSESQSKHKPITYGVPQGSILGPKRFSIFVNDHPESITGGNVFMFADDTRPQFLQLAKDIDSHVWGRRRVEVPGNTFSCQLTRDSFLTRWLQGFAQLSVRFDEISSIVWTDCLRVSSSPPKPSQCHDERISTQVACYLQVDSAGSKACEDTSPPLPSHSSSLDANWAKIVYTCVGKGRLVKRKSFSGRNGWLSSPSFAKKTIIDDPSNKRLSSQDLELLANKS